MRGDSETLSVILAGARWLQSRAIASARGRHERGRARRYNRAWRPRRRACTLAQRLRDCAGTARRQAQVQRMHALLAAAANARRQIFPYGDARATADTCHAGVVATASAQSQFAQRR
ncbi:hypothetical protein [Lysobacter gummosus]|uniref:hypothetical protein n=1 Tax=Lysobacter gummosus TaxID=262324 RepID=UPI003641A5B4